MLRCENLGKKKRHGLVHLRNQRKVTEAQRESWTGKEMNGFLWRFIMELYGNRMFNLSKYGRFLFSSMFYCNIKTLFLSQFYENSNVCMVKTLLLLLLFCFFNRWPSFVYGFNEKHVLALKVCSTLTFRCNNLHMMALFNVQL